MKFSVRGVAVAITSVMLIAGCEGGRENLSSSTISRSSPAELQFTIDHFAELQDGLPYIHAILHSSDGEEVETDIDLRQTQGIAKFGDIGRSEANLSLVFGWPEDESYFVLSFNDIPVRSYHLNPGSGVPAGATSIDVALESSAVPDGAHVAGVFGYGNSYIWGYSDRSENEWEFQQLEVASSPGRLFGWARNDDSGEIRFGTFTTGSLENDGRYSLVVDQAPSVIAVDDLPEQAIAWGELFLEGQQTGGYAWTLGSDAAPGLPLDVDLAAAQVLLTASIDDPAAETWIYRQEKLQAIPARYAPSFWDIRIESSDYDYNNHTQFFQYSSPIPAQAASSCTVLGDSDGYSVWCVIAPASSGALHLPQLPEDLAETLDRDEVDDLWPLFLLERAEQLNSFGEWLDWMLASEDPTNMALDAIGVLSEANFDDGDNSLCMNVNAIQICIDNPLSSKISRLQNRHKRPGH